MVATGRRLALALALALASALAHAAAVPAAPIQPMPASSRDRAERVRSWRAALDRAEAARATGRPDEARSLYAEVLAAADVAGAELYVARAVDGLADLDRSAGDHAAAIPRYERAVAAWRRLLGPDQPRLATSLHNLAACRAATGDRAGAALAAREALAIWERRPGGGGAEAETMRRLLAVVDQGAGATGNR